MSDIRIKDGLYRSYAENKREQKRQTELKEKHGIHDENVVVVEKSAAPRIALHILATVVRTILTIIVFLFAVIGLLAIIYPEPRDEVTLMLKGIRDQIYGFLPFLEKAFGA